jgi:hypothetical protein
LKLLQKKLGDDFHPLVEMGDMYSELKGEGDAADKGHRVQLLKEMAQYTLPKLKATEISGELSGRVTLERTVRRLDGAEDD